MEQGRFRVGLRVPDVDAAAFYRAFGFAEVGSVPGDDGRPIMTILERDGALLIVDALSGMPFRDDERERQVQRGPRGLGVSIGVGVDDLSAAYELCLTSGCEILEEPAEQPWGDRVFECLDPFGYLLEVSQAVHDMNVDEALSATRDEWRGSSS